MRHEDLLTNGQRKTLLNLAGADDDGLTIPPARNRNVVKLVETGFANVDGSRYRISAAGWAWLREALADRIPAQVTADLAELRQWQQVRADFAEAGIHLPDIN